MKQFSHRILLSKVLFLLFFVLLPTAVFSQIIGWNAASTGGGFGASPWTPETLNANLTTSGLIRGSSILTSGSPATGAWGGSGGWSTTQSDANSFYFTMTAKTGYKVSLTSISSATRRSNSGPSGIIVYYSVNGGAFVNAGSWTTTSTSGTTGTANSTNLAGIAALQDVAAGTTIKFRLIPQGSTGNYYLTGGTNSLRINGTVAAAINPLIDPSVTTLPSFGNIVVGEHSASASFTLDGEGLTNDVSVAAPAGFEISTDNTNWYAGTDLSPVAGMLDGVLIYVRFSPVGTGPATGDISLTSGGAADKTVAVSGTGLPANAITVSPSLISNLGYPENGGPSAAFQLTNLTTVGLDPSTGNLTFSLDQGATSNFEISIDGTTWSESVQYPYTNADNNINNPAIYIRLKSGLAQGAVPQESVTVAGGGLSSFFSVSGVVAPPSTIAVDDEPYGPFCNATAHTFDVDFTPSGGFISSNYYAQLSNPDGTFPTTPTNIVGTSATSPVPVTIPANTVAGSYRVRIYNDNPLTFSTNDNGNDIVINQASGLSGILQSDAVCSGTDATFELSGLLPGSISSLTYTIGSGSVLTITGITADALGTATFALPLLANQNAQTLTVTNIERTDVTPSCNNTVDANNTVILAVNPMPTLTAVSSSIVCGDGELTTVSLSGLLPGTTSDITYTIAAGDPVVASNILSDASGNASFTLPMVLANNGSLLEITSVSRTDNQPNCTTVFSGIVATLTINARPTGNLSGDQTLCFGNASNAISIGLTGTAPWNVSYTDGSATFFLNNISESPYTFTVNTFGTKTYTLVAVSDAHCSASAAGLTGSATVTVDPPTNGGMISGSTAVCYGSNAGNLTLTNNNGTIIKWQSSGIIDFSSSVVDIDTTTGTLAYSDLTQTTYYRAVVQSGICPPAFSATAAVNVTIVPAPSASDQVFCNEATVADLLPNGNGIQWYAAAQGGAALPSTETLTTGNYYASLTIDGCESARTLTGVTVNQPAVPVTAPQTLCNGATVSDLLPNDAGLTWYAVPNGGSALPQNQLLSSGDYYVANSIEGCESERIVAVVTINEVMAPETSNQNFCNSATVADLAPNGADIRWYATATDQTPLPLTQMLSTGAYYASLTVNGCESDRSLTIVTISIPTPPAAESQVFCQQATIADLTPNGGGIKWYDAAISQTALSESTVLSTANYFVSITIDGCESERTVVPVTVTVSPSPTVLPQTFCDAAVVSDLFPNGNGILWYDSAIATTPLTADTVLTTGNYFVSNTVAGCESEKAMASVTVTIAPAPTVLPQTFCNAATVADLTPNGNGIQWYESAVATTALTAETALTTGNYFVSNTVEGCESEKTMVPVTVTIPSSPTVLAQTFCNAGTVADLSPNGNGILWYDSAIATAPLTAETALTTGNYFVSNTVGNCESDRTVIPVSLETISIPQGDSLQDFDMGESIADLDVDGNGLVWYGSAEDAADQTDDLDTNQQLIDGATYYVVATTTDCQSEPLAITVSVVLGTNEFNNAALKYYPNPFEGVLNISYDHPIDSIIVYNMLGQAVADKDFDSSQVQLDLSMLPAGSYVLKVFCGRTSKTVKVIKK